MTSPSVEPSARADVLAIVGSRQFTYHLWTIEARRIIEGVLDRQRPDAVISGGAAGIDFMAKTVATQRGIFMLEFLPRVYDWDPPGDVGFKRRNDEIARTCTRMLCIRSRNAKTYGSGYTADVAEELGKTVWRVDL